MHVVEGVEAMLPQRVVRGCPSNGSAGFCFGGKKKKVE